MRFYRVYAHDPNAAPTDRGGALYTSIGGSNRIDNPEIYRVLYVSSHAEGAVAEKFGRIPLWDDYLFVQTNGNRYALATFEIADHALICNLNDAARLVELGLRPTDVIDRDRAVSQQWARRIFQSGTWIGAAWWSYYSPRWLSAGIWNLQSVNVAGPPVLLQATSQEVVEAANTIVRVIR